MGFGGGKTLCGCVDQVLTALNYPNARLLDVSPSYQLAKRTTIPHYQNIIQHSGLDVRFNKTDHEFKFSNGSIIWVASGDNPDSLRGPNISRARIDEPFIQDVSVYQHVVARLRSPEAPLGLFLTGTPEQLNWGYDLLFGDMVKPKDGTESKITRHIVQESSRKNTALPEIYIQNLEETYDEQMARAYIEGDFVQLNTNLAYHTWDGNDHCGSYEYDPDLKLYFTLDFNVKPFCACVIQQHGDVDWIIDEIHLKDNGTTRSACAAFRGKYPNHKAGVCVTGDPAGNARNTQSTIGGYNNFSIVRDELGDMPGFILSPPIDPPEHANSLNQTNARLRNTKGESKLFVDRHCKFTIQDFERVRRTNDNKIDKDDENLTHHTDAVRYYLWQFRRNWRIG